MTLNPRIGTWLAASVPLRPEVECYPLQRANEALLRLKRGGVRGALVLDIGR